MNPIRLSCSAILALILIACADVPADAPAATGTPDPCVLANLNQTIKPINDLQREFNDASELAANLPREQLQSSISEMQRIRRVAEDQAVPDCLSALKQHQLAHMNAVINTLVSFVGGADSQSLNRGMAEARDQYDQYTFEMARLLGVTLVPATNTAAPSP